MKTNKKCVVCGRDYAYCYSCPHKDPVWKQTFCCEDCRKIYHAVAGYNTKTRTREEAIELLKSADLSHLETMSQNIQEVVKQLLPSQPEKVVKTIERQGVLRNAPAFTLEVDKED